MKINTDSEQYVSKTLPKKKSKIKKIKSIASKED